MGDAFVAKVSPSGRFRYVTTVGGTNEDSGSAVAVNAAGDVFATGLTTSDDFPLEHAFQQRYHGPSIHHLPPQGATFSEDSWVAKFDRLGRLIYSSYLGGKQNDEATGIGVDQRGEAVVVGWTASRNFPATQKVKVAFDPPLNRYPQPAGGTFVVKVSASGARIIWSALVPHWDPNPGTGAVVDQRGAIYLPLLNHLLKLDPTGSRTLYRVRFGGMSAQALNVAVDRMGRAYVTGAISDGSLQLVAPLQARFSGGTCGQEDAQHVCSDAFVAEVGRGGRLVFNTYFGGNADDEGQGIAAFNADNVYVVGMTNSSNFPTKNAQRCSKAENFAFLAKLRLPRTR